MAPKTAQPAKSKPKTGGKAKTPQKKPETNKTVDRDGGLYRVYARLEKQDKDTLDQLAAADERSSMKYLERLIRKHCEQARAKKTK